MHPEQFAVDWAGYYRYALEQETRVRAAYPHERHVMYGTHDHQLMNIFRPGGDPDRDDGWPVFVWAHGGAFREGHPDFHDWLAPTFVSRGALFVTIGYRLLPTPIADSIADYARALGWLSQHIATRGGDPHNLHIGGHSAGAMAAASLAVRDDWQAEAGVTADAIVSLLALIGIYDFAEQMRVGVLPPRDDAYQSVEPLRNVRQVPPLSLVAFGTNELNRRNVDGRIFATNGRAFAEQLRNAGAAVEELELPDATQVIRFCCWGTVMIA